VRYAKDWGVTAAVAILLAGLACAKPSEPEFEYDWDLDPAATFEGVRSFAWIPEDRVAVGDPRIDDAALERAVREAVDRELVEKGYTPETAETPDFWVAYHASLTKRLDARSLDATYRVVPTRIFTGQPEPVEYDAGTLVLDVITPDGATLIWRGRVQTRVETTDTFEVRRARLDRAVEGMLAPFPAVR
jgi:hypothetical protein